jgi:hypothetical protein
MILAVFPVFLNPVVSTGHRHRAPRGDGGVDERRRLLILELSQVGDQVVDGQLVASPLTSLRPPRHPLYATRSTPPLYATRSTL